LKNNLLKLKKESIVDSRFKLLAADFQDQIDDLKSKVVTLESSKTNSKDDVLHAIKKRQTHEMVQEPGKVKGIPSSCTDLKLLGHKLNGVYLIKTSRPDQGIKVEAVFCDFQSSTSVSGKKKQYLIIHVSSISIV